MEEKYGFVYIWRDRVRNRYYIGAHWGTEDDGYICSSKWMKKVYKKRPKDFKRRILIRIYSSKKDTFVTEERWLQLIKPEELGKRYYNLYCKDYWLNNNRKLRNLQDEVCRKNNREIGQKKRLVKIKELWEDPKHRQKISNAMKKSWEDQERREILSLRMKKYHEDENIKEKTSKITKGTRWFTDGIVDKRYITGDEPKDFYYGRSKHNVVGLAGPTGITGISYNKRRKKYLIRVTINKKRITIGYANTLDEAIRNS